MHFGFSYIGLIFLLMLFIPNFFWTKNKPKDYDEYAKCENKVLLILERIGEVAVSCLILIFSDFNPQGLSIWLLWLFASFGCMILYELYWIRYFRSENDERFLQQLFRYPCGRRNPACFISLIYCGLWEKSFSFCSRYHFRNRAHRYSPDAQKGNYQSGKAITQILIYSINLY